MPIAGLGRSSGATKARRIARGVPMCTRGPLAIGLAAMPLAFLVRLAALHFQPFVTFDGTEYIGIAEALRAGRLAASLFPPGYPALVALALSLTPDRVMAAAGVSLVSGTLITLPVAVLAQRAIGPGWSWVPVLLVSVHPVLAHFSALPMSEAPYLLAIFSAIALVTSRRNLLSGLAFGLAFAIRPEALVIGLFALGVVSAQAMRGERPNRSIAILVLGFLLLATPCWLLFRTTLGVWTLTPKLSALREPTIDWRSAEPRQGGDIVPPSERFGLVERLREHGPAAIRAYSANCRTVWQEVLILWPIPLLGLAAWGAWTRRGLESLPIPYLALLPLLGLSMQPRFAIGAVPSLAILSAIPVARTAGRAAGWLCGSVLVVGYAWCAWAYLPEFTSAFDGNMGPAKRAGEWIMHSSESRGAVMGRKPFVAFYARRPNFILPDAPYDSIVVAAQRNGVRYIVVEERLVERVRPQLAKLVHDSAFLEQEQRIELAYVGGEQPGYGLALFRVLAPGEPKGRRAPKTEFLWMR